MKRFLLAFLCCLYLTSEARAQSGLGRGGISIDGLDGSHLLHLQFNEFNEDLLSPAQIDASAMVVTEASTITIGNGQSVKTNATGSRSTMTIAFSGGPDAAMTRHFKCDVNTSATSFTLNIPPSRVDNESGSIDHIVIPPHCYFEADWVFVDGEYVVDHSISSTIAATTQILKGDGNRNAVPALCGVDIICVQLNPEADYIPIGLGPDFSGNYSASWQPFIVTDNRAALANKPSFGVVAASVALGGPGNLTLSGLQTIDGAGTTGTIVLATAQTTTSENGFWVMGSGAWTRPSWYPNGGTAQAFQFVSSEARLGSRYQGTMWKITSSGAPGTVTIGTSGTTWQCTGKALNQYTVPAPSLAMSVTADTDTLKLVGDSATPGNNKVYGTNGSGAKGWQAASSGGTVTSVDVTLPAEFNVSGGPITTSGTIVATFATQIANKFKAGPTSGGSSTPTYRYIVGADLPNPSSSTLGGVQSYAAVSHQWINSISTSGVPASTQPAFSDISGNIATSQMNSGTNADSSHWWRGDGQWATIATGLGDPGGNGIVNRTATNTTAVATFADLPTYDAGDGGAPAVAVRVMFQAYKTGINAGSGTTTAGQNVFTVPTSRTFVCTGADLFVTTVSGGTSGALNFNIKESGGNANLTVGANSGASQPGVGSIYNSTNSNSAAPYVTCAAGNNVQVKINTAQASTTVTCTAFVRGYYAQ